MSCTDAVIGSHLRQHPLVGSPLQELQLSPDILGHKQKLQIEHQVVSTLLNLLERTHCGRNEEQEVLAQHRGAISDTVTGRRSHHQIEHHLRGQQERLFRF